MPMRMTRLVYVSRMTEACDTDALEKILKVSRVNNSEKNVTGILCYDPAFFMQCLEGPRLTVNALYTDIQRDQRHKDVTMLAYEEAEKRLFDGWSMAFIRSSSIDETVMQQYIGSGRFDPYSLSGKQAVQFLLDVSKQTGVKI